MPVATAWAPPHDVQTTCVTRPVGSPPLKISAGLICPNPWPCAKTPAGWPSGGTAADGLAEARAVGEEVVATLAGGEAGGAVVVAGVVAVAVARGAVALGAAAACETAEQPAAARPAEAIATPARRRAETAAQRPRAAASPGAIPRGELPVFLALFM